MPLIQSNLCAGRSKKYNGPHKGPRAWLRWPVGRICTRRSADLGLVVIRLFGDADDPEQTRGLSLVLGHTIAPQLGRIPDRLLGQRMVARCLHHTRHLSGLLPQKAIRTRPISTAIRDLCIVNGLLQHDAGDIFDNAKFLSFELFVLVAHAWLLPWSFSPGMFSMRRTSETGYHLDICDPTLGPALAFTLGGPLSSVPTVQISIQFYEPIEDHRTITCRATYYVWDNA